MKQYMLATENFYYLNYTANLLLLEFFSGKKVKVIWRRQHENGRRIHKGTSDTLSLMESFLPVWGMPINVGYLLRLLSIETVYFTLIVYFNLWNESLSVLME